MLSLSNLNTQTIPAKYSFIQDLGVNVNILIILIWSVLTIFYAFTVNRKKGPILWLASFMGLAFTTIIARINFDLLVSYQSEPFFLLGVFIFTSLLAFVTLARAIIRHITVHLSKNGRLIMSALEVGAFLASIGFLLPYEIQVQLEGFAALLFVTPWSLLLWFSLPLVVLWMSDHRRI